MEDQIIESYPNLEPGNHFANYHRFQFQILFLPEAIDSAVKIKNSQLSHGVKGIFTGLLPVGD